jgi:MFS family permease
VRGFAAFRLLWLGQALALLGREMTWFALTLYAYQKTGQATTLSLLGFFHFLPLILFSPLAGALVDRYPRKWAMLAADLGGGLATGFLLLLYLMGRLEVGPLYLVSALTGALSSLHWPALSAALSAMLEKRDYARASGMMSLAGPLADRVFGPRYGQGEGITLILGGKGVAVRGKPPSWASPAKAALWCQNGGRGKGGHGRRRGGKGPKALLLPAGWLLLRLRGPFGAAEGGVNSRAWKSWKP